jgi:hypothetical protein
LTKVIDEKITPYLDLSLDQLERDKVTGSMSHVRAQVIRRINVESPGKLLYKLEISIIKEVDDK